MKADSMRNDIWKWLTLLIIAVFSIYVTFPTKEKLRFGLDLKGGTSFTLGVDKEKLRETILAANPALSNDTVAVEKKIQDTPVLEGCDYVVTAIPDSAKGEKIVLLYQGDKDPKDVLSQLRAAGFPPIMLPAAACAVDKVPKLGTGKADFTTAKKLAKELVAKK